VSATSGRRGRSEKTWRWCAEEDSHLHSRVATGLQPAGFATYPSRHANTARC